MAIVHQWFLQNKVLDLEGNEIEGMKLSTKHKHNIVRRIHTSREISSQ